MLSVFAHEAVVTMQAGADVRAPGAAITAELCGHWEHPLPCPLAAHHTRAERVGDRVHLRTLFAAEPADEQVVRGRVEAALARGRVQGPDGTVTCWELNTSRSSEITVEESPHARRLVGG